MFIRLTEIINEGGKPVEQPVLINTEHVLGVSVGKFENTDKGIHIVGQSKASTVSLIQLTSGRPVFVKESIEHIEALVSDHITVEQSLN